MINKINLKELKTLLKVEEINSLIQHAKNISLITHQNPDGDAIGSMLALYHFLQQYKGKEIHAIVPDDFPDFLAWMPKSEEILICTNVSEEIIKVLENSDLIICLDFNHTSRIQCLRETVLNVNADKVLIDHHPNPEDFTRFVFSETNVSSTSELLYHIMTSLEGEIDKDIAACLFTGIMTDTGGFSHNSSSPGTYEIVAELLKTGIDKNAIFDNIYNNFTSDRMRLMGYCLNEKMKVFPEYKTAYISITKEEMNKYNFKTGDTEGFVNLPLSIKGIVISALFIERDGMIKASFRSKGKVAVNELSKKHFNGGGHRNAAGGELYESMDKTLEKFISILPEYRNEIEKV